MQRYSITLKRYGMRGFLSRHSIGTDAINALRSIPGVDEVEIACESAEQVELIYSWVGKNKFWETDERLEKFGLARIDLG